MGGRTRARGREDDAGQRGICDRRRELDLAHGARGRQDEPEELLAAAHASCYCMQLAHELGEAGPPPERLEATARVEFVPGEGVTSSHSVVTGRVPSIDEQAFGAAADAAGDGCPISGALKGNVEITVEATLES